MNGTRLYKIWCQMKQRCNNSNNTAYHRYGGRGIIVCDEWANDFMIFYDWSLCNGYSNDLSIDRIDNDGNYEPSNCRWATTKIQQRNTTRIHKHNKTGFRGVSYIKDRGKFKSGIRVNGKSVHIGYFKCRYCAALSYDDYVIKNKLEHTINF